MYEEEHIRSSCNPMQEATPLATDPSEPLNHRAALPCCIRLSQPDTAVEGCSGVEGSEGVGGRWREHV